MNRPGGTEGHWEWRFDWRQVDAWHAERLAGLARLYARIPRCDRASQVGGDCPD
jgi:4-alpha-glucanotransferase